MSSTCTRWRQVQPILVLSHAYWIQKGFVVPAVAQFYAGMAVVGHAHAHHQVSCTGLVRPTGHVRPCRLTRCSRRHVSCASGHQVCQDHSSRNELVWCGCLCLTHAGSVCTGSWRPRQAAGHTACVHSSCRTPLPESCPGGAAHKVRRPHMIVSCNHASLGKSGPFKLGLSQAHGGHSRPARQWEDHSCRAGQRAHQPHVGKGPRP